MSSKIRLDSRQSWFGSIEFFFVNLLKETRIMQKKTKLIRLIVEREIQSSFLGEIVSSWLVTKMLICSKCLNGKQIWKKSETVHEGINEFRISINILFSSPNSRAFPQKKDKEFRDLCTWEFSLISLFFYNFANTRAKLLVDKGDICHFAKVLFNIL